MVTALKWTDPLEGKRGHALLTQDAIKNVRPLGAGREDSEIKANWRAINLKLFSPYSNWTWYVLELDPETGEAYGLVDGQEKEWGYFDIHEMAKVQVDMEWRGVSAKVPAIEHDCYWTPITVRELKTKLELL